MFEQFSELSSAGCIVDGSVTCCRPVGAILSRDAATSVASCCLVLAVDTYSTSCTGERIA